MHKPRINVDEVVSQYQKSREEDEFIIIKKHYDSYKEYWFARVQEYVDYDEFETEYYVKLMQAVDNYDNDRATELCRERGWSFSGKFNRWFYRTLSNWAVNVKSNGFRTKARPPVMCPVCNRFVQKIDEKHLQHFITTKDVPKTFKYNGCVFKTYLSPKKFARIVGQNSSSNKCEWIWFLKDGTEGVFCPFTRKIVPKIDQQYLDLLPEHLKHYATPIKWQEFVQQYPYILPHSEVFSLEYGDDDGKSFKDTVHRNMRVGRAKETAPCYYEDMSSPKVAPSEYESVLNIIKNNVSDREEKEILKMFVTGSSENDICAKLSMTKRQLKNHMEHIRNNCILEASLSEASIM